MPKNKILGKMNNLETCIRRIHEVYDGKEEEFLENLIWQESVLLNLQRACENAIDLANLLVAEKNWGVPSTSRESFEILEKNQVISAALTAKMTAMVGLRNLLVHQYIRINMASITDLIEQDLDDLLEFSRVVLRYIENRFS